VEFRTRRSEVHNATSIVQNAKLVVDASGRHSKAAKWLAALALSTPSETVVTNQPYTVSSALCAMPADFAEDWKQLTLIPATLDLGISVNLQAIEGRRWIIFVTTSGATRPPTDRQAFLALLGEVEQPLLRQYLSNLQLLSPISGTGHTNNRWRHYEALRDQPDNFVALGDAVAVLHPGYGAGMAIAAKEALALADCLQEQRSTEPSGEACGFARRFQQRIASIIADQWAIETAEGNG
jgi:2-polyprenyl-6-methoxyphenol hydroxylase-like FAD-dependent oxidoreductase